MSLCLLSVGAPLSENPSKHVLPKILEIRIIRAFPYIRVFTARELKDTFKTINVQGNIPRRVNGIDCTVFVDWAPCPVPNYSVRYMINIPAVRRTFQVESIKTWTEYVTRWKVYFLPSAVLKRGHVISPFCSSVKYLEIETAAKNEKRLWDLTHFL